MTGIRASNTGLRDDDDDYAYQQLVGDTERLSQRAQTLADLIAVAQADLVAAQATIAALGSTYLARANNLSDVVSASTSRTNLGLGTIATQDASAVSVTGGSVTGITDLTIADGGTGASDAATARTNLGLGTAATAASASFLAVASNLSDVGNAGTSRTNLGLGTIATQNASAIAVTGGSIIGITDLAIADGGTGASDAATARTNIGLGTMATQNANSVSVTGGSVTGITDLTVADGGTGSSTSSGARTNLGAAASGSNADITSMSGLTGTMTFTFGTNSLVIASANFVGTGKAVQLREIDVCELGMAKKMLVLCSATY